MRTLIAILALGKCLSLQQYISMYLLSTQHIWYLTICLPRCSHTADTRSDYCSLCKKLLVQWLQTYKLLRAWESHWSETFKYGFPVEWVTWASTLYCRGHIHAFGDMKFGARTLNTSTPDAQTSKARFCPAYFSTFYFSTYFSNAW
jgi:hypothetical protein